jgi:AAA+ superfamily predicted ATPase
MKPQENLIRSIREAVAQAPQDVDLRIHLADLLMEAEQYQEAIQEYRLALEARPTDASIKFSLADAYFHGGKYDVALVVLEELLKSPDPSPKVYLLAARCYHQSGQMGKAGDAYHHAVKADPSLADESLDGVLGRPERREEDKVKINAGGTEADLSVDVERPSVTFHNVGGMDKLKAEVRMKIILPLTNPEMFRAYGKSVGGGILMYGPPGCGKTHLARATAGEVKARFLSIGIHDILDMYLGQSERNLHGIFELARANTPCVLFFDEVDALGASRSDMRQSAGRHVINQFLSEMDGIASNNSGVLILAATNAPWYVDTALRRPGRFDRVIFVPPPDDTARTAILKIILEGKPLENMNYEKVSAATEGFSGADLRGLVDQAVEQKLDEAMKKGKVLPLTTQDLISAAKNLKPTTRDWFETAKNYALYSNQSGFYDDIVNYMDPPKDSGWKFPFSK